MSAIIDYFASDVNYDEFLYCVKCLESGLISKKFSKDNEGLLLEHLLECHEILVSEVLAFETPTESIPDQIIQFSLAAAGEIDEFAEPEENGFEITPRNRQSAVWNYFEENENRLDCLLCQESGIIHYYSTNSSTSNLRKHLLSTHQIKVENIRPQKKKPPKIRKKSAISRVWRYFSQVIIDGNGAQVSQEDFVYCRKCLEMRVQHKYKRTTSTGTMKSHLSSVHGIEVTEDPENEEPMEVLTEDAVCSILSESETICVPKKSMRQSVARSYFQNIDRDYLYCMICNEEGREHKYSKSTSTTALKTHLLQVHMIDTAQQDATNQETVFEIRDIREPRLENTFILTDEEIQSGVVQKAQKLTKIRSRKIRTYFMSLVEEDMVYCAFCVAAKQRKGYNTRTSTSVLRKHLQTNHDFDPLKLFEENMNAEINEEELFKDSIQQSHKNRGDIWKYFSHKVIEENGVQKLDESHVYCNLCWNAPIREIQKYSTSTSSGGLRRHLRSRHRLFISTKPRVEEIIQVVAEEDLEEEEVVESEIIEVETKREAKYCRSCGRTDEVGYFTKLSASFDDEEDNPTDLTLADLYADVTGVYVSETDQMSQLICYMCEASLKHSYKFKRIALETEHLMLEKFQQCKEEEETEDYEYLETEDLDEVIEDETTSEMNLKAVLISPKKVKFRKLTFTSESSKNRTVLDNDKKVMKTERIEEVQEEDNEEFDSLAEEYDVPIAVYDMRTSVGEGNGNDQRNKKLRLN